MFSPQPHDLTRATSAQIDEIVTYLQRFEPGEDRTIYALGTDHASGEEGVGHIVFGSTPTKEVLPDAVLDLVGNSSERQLSTPATPRSSVAASLQRLESDGTLFENLNK